SIVSVSEPSIDSCHSSYLLSFSYTDPGACGVASSPALAQQHDMHDCLESGLSAPQAEHVQMRVSADSASRSGSFCFVLRFIVRRFIAELFEIPSTRM